MWIVGLSKEKRTLPPASKYSLKAGLQGMDTAIRKRGRMRKDLKHQLGPQWYEGQPQLAAEDWHVFSAEKYFWWCVSCVHLHLCTIGKL